MIVSQDKNEMRILNDLETRPVATVQFYQISNIDCPHYTVSSICIK